jgi:hypothetical protein
VGSSTRSRYVGAAAACVAMAIGSSAAAAEPRKAILAPTVIGQPGSFHRPGPGDGDLRSVAAALDATLSDTAQDLGLSLDVGHPPSPDLGRSTEAELAERAHASESVVLVPSVRSEGGRVAIRLQVIDPSGKSIHVRNERTSAGDAPVRAVVLLRDLVGDLDMGTRVHAAKEPLVAPKPAAPAPPQPAPHSVAGKATLLVNATLFGGFLGFSVQQASGSSDPRVLYPLLAVGAGIGLGGSMIITEEWEVSPADAWYLAAGMWWPTIAGHFIFQGRFAATSVDSDRWEFGLIGGTTGLALAGLGLALHPMSDGGAWLAHSGGALGLGFGGLIEFAGRGDINTTPFAGMGYGAALGWLAAAAAATQVKVSSTQVLAIDIGALVGGLGGAAAGSPLVFHEPTHTQQRAWVGIVAGAAILGGGVGAWLGRSAKQGPASKSAWLVPSLDVLGESAIGGRRAPIVGLAWSGTLDAANRPGPR